MGLERLKKQLIGRGILLNILEVGCGTPFTEEFTKDDGASKYIYSTVSPYSKEAQIEFLGSHGEKSVSKEFVYRAVNQLATFCSKKVNCINVAVSMQVGETKDTHGWISIDNDRIYHFSFGHGMNRSIARMNVSSLIISILNWSLEPGNDVFNTEMSAFIDGVFTDGGFNVNNLQFKPLFMPPNHAPFMIVDGKWRRATEVLRVYDRLNIVKGSFNPFHEGHKQLTQLMPGNTILSMTTASTVQGKPSITLIDAVERIKGLPIPTMIDSDCVYYSDLFKKLKILVDSLPDLTFSMGIDVFIKYKLIPGIKINVISRNMTVDEVTFIQANDPNLSSTKLRKNEINTPINQ